MKQHKLKHVESFKLLKRLEEVLIVDTENHTAYYKVGFSDKVIASEFPGLNVQHVSVRRRDVFGNFPEIVVPATTDPDVLAERVGDIEMRMVQQTQLIVGLVKRLSKLERDLGVAPE